jgi:hypothetical protein
MLLVGARSELGHYAAILLVHSLAGYYIAEQLAVAKHRGSGIVAARLDGKKGKRHSFLNFRK